MTIITLKRKANVARRSSPGFVHTWWRARKIRGWLNTMDAQNLYRLARDGPGEGAIVEVGSAWGRSTAFLAAGAKAGHRERVFAIDPHTGDVFDPNYCEGMSSYEEFRENMERMGVNEWVIPVVKTSEEAARDFPRTQVRLLFIDGMHTYDAVKLDIELWASQVIPGGNIVFDDYQFPEVARAIDEYLSKGCAAQRPYQMGESHLTVIKL